MSVLPAGEIWWTQKWCSINYPHPSKFKPFNFYLPQSILSLLLSGAIWGTQKCCSIHYPHHTKFKSFFNFNLPQSILSLLPAGEIWWTQNWFIRYWHQTKFKPYKFWLASIYSVSPASWWDLRDPELVFHPPPAWVQIQTCRMLIYCSRDRQKNSKFLLG
jgi:hypothetical protein